MMELILIIILIILMIITISLIIFFRPKQASSAGLLPEKVQALQNSLSRIESNLKEDFRIHREENSGIAKENRNELNATLKDFRSEMTETLRAITTQNQKALELVNKTLEEKFTALIQKVDENNRTNREAIISGLREFIHDHGKKLDEWRQEQKDHGFRSLDQLEKITNKIDERLTALSQQARTDSQLIRETLSNTFRIFGETFDKNVSSFNDLQREKFAQLEEKQGRMVESTEKKLEEMRMTVDEKLQKTLTERLGQSFEMVGRHLESVQKGLGEMQILAQDVGGLKKVLSNVKMRGGIGEVQLAMLLEQVLAPEQYVANVKTKHDSSDAVEFAIKFPGRDEDNSVVYLPVDAKFPKDIYEQLQDAYDSADTLRIEIASRNMEAVIKKMARDIRDKYIDPPYTTDFAIMFLPFEGIYAEVIRKASLLDQLQREFKVIITGPTTLAAILNSLQMGFHTLALQKRSSEVWKILGAVKTEFEKFGGLMEKAQKNLHTASSQIDELLGTRTRAINRRLRNIEALPGVDSQQILPEIVEGSIVDEEELNEPAE